jgi:small subunit ribosomal protein S4
VTVNGRKVDIPSFQVKVGDMIAIKDATRTNVFVEGAWSTAAGRGRPSWISPADTGDFGGNRDDFAETRRY